MNLPNYRHDQTKAMQMATHLEKRPMLEVSSTLSNLYIDFFPSIKTPFKKSKPAHLVGVQNDTMGLSLCLCILTENDLFEIDR